MSFRDTLQTFSSANVRRLYLGNFSVYLGFWLSFLSIIWLVFRMTSSSLTLGNMGLLLCLPIFILLPFAGVIADRLNKRNILVFCAGAMTIAPLLLAWLSWTDRISLFSLALVAPWYIAFYAVMNPAATSFIKEVIDDQEDVHRVTGLLSANTKIAQLAASAMNGLLHLLFSVAGVFFFAFLAHFTSFIAFFRIRNQTLAHKKHEAPFRELLEGAFYVFSFAPFWSILMVASTASLIVLAWQWQLPIFAGKILAGNAKTLSGLFFWGGIGGIFGGIYVSGRRYSAGLMRLANLALVCLGFALLGFAFSSFKMLSYALTFIIDGSWVMVLAATSATLQLIVDESKRGRVMSFYAMGVFGLMPFMNFIVGGLCSLLGVQWGIGLMGIFCVLVALFYRVSLSSYRRQLMGLYSEKGFSEFERPV